MELQVGDRLTDEEGEWELLRRHVGPHGAPDVPKRGKT